jgi:rubredoxin
MEGYIIAALIGYLIGKFVHQCPDYPCFFREIIPDSHPCPDCGNQMESTNKIIYPAKLLWYCPSCNKEVVEQ